MGQRAIKQRFESYFGNRTPPRTPNYTYAWYSYYRAVIARRESSEPLNIAYGRLDAKLKREKDVFIYFGDYMCKVF